MIAPTAAQVPLHPDGEAGMHRAGVACANTPMILSHNTSQSVEQVAGREGQLWWQFYPRQGLEAQPARSSSARRPPAAPPSWSPSISRRRTTSARSRIAIWAASPRTGGRGGRGGGRRRSRSGSGRAGAPVVAAARCGGCRNRCDGPALYRLGAGRLWYTWRYLDDIRKIIKVPMLVKGIMTAEDARLCVEHGVDGIIVSNHGGRSMDYGPSTLEALPEIVAAVNGRIPVIIDSGFRRGSDVLKALALGANAVMFGRATRWALGAFGPAGVAEAVQQHPLPRAGQRRGGGGHDDGWRQIDKSIIRTMWP